MPAKPTGPQRWIRHLSAGGFLGGASLAVVLLSSWLGAGAREASGYVFYGSITQAPARGRRFSGAPMCGRRGRRCP